MVFSTLLDSIQHSCLTFSEITSTGHSDTIPRSLNIMSDPRFKKKRHSPVIWKWNAGFPLTNV